MRVTMGTLVPAYDGMQLGSWGNEVDIHSGHKYGVTCRLYVWRWLKVNICRQCALGGSLPQERNGTVLGLKVIDWTSHTISVTYRVFFFYWCGTTWAILQNKLLDVGQLFKTFPLISARNQQRDSNIRLYPTPVRRIVLRTKKRRTPAEWETIRLFVGLGPAVGSYERFVNER